MRKLVRALIELLIRNLLIAHAHSNGARRPLTLLFNQIVETYIARILCPGRVPLEENLPALLLSKNRQRRERRFRFSHGRFQQRCIVLRHSLHGRFIEQIGVVLDPSAHPFGSLREECRNIEFCSGFPMIQKAHLQPCKFKGLARHVLK